MPPQEHIHLSFNLSVITNLKMRLIWQKRLKRAFLGGGCVYIYTQIYIYRWRYTHRERGMAKDSLRYKIFILWEGINLRTTFHFHLTFQKTWLNSISWQCNWFSLKGHLSENKLGFYLGVYILWLLHINWYFKRSSPILKALLRIPGKKN